MWTRMSLVRFFGCLLLVAVIGTANVYAEPEPMARPTRPKTFVNSVGKDQFNDFLLDYYTMRTSRYGKRGGDAAPRMSELKATWETLKMILDAQRQHQQQRRLASLKPDKEQEIAYRDFRGLDTDRHSSRLALRPGQHLLDVVGRYYDNVQ